MWRQKRSPCLLRGKTSLITVYFFENPTSRCSHRREENTCNEPCSPAFYACVLEREPQCSLVNGKDGDGGAGQPREFVTTRWSLIFSAANGSEEQKARDALAELCRTYWRPIFSFVQARGFSVEDAQDLTQDFFVTILKNELVAARRS